MKGSLEGIEDWLRPRREVLDRFLRERLAGAWPPRFGEALLHPLDGGKRIRPAIVWAACEAVATDPGHASAVATAPAAAVELVHTYSLVHDDLPCMDDDALRRGRPTVHVVFGEAAAVLTGDALLTEAFAVLADAAVDAEARVRMIAVLARAAGMRGMVGGQAADVGLAGPIADLDAHLRVHEGKTGALIEASAVLGGIAGGAGGADIDALAAWGRAVGLAFQLADDLLDAGRDAGRPSFVSVLGAGATKERAQALTETAAIAVRELRRHERLDELARFAIDRSH